MRYRIVFFLLLTSILVVGCQRSTTVPVPDSAYETPVVAASSSVRPTITAVRLIVVEDGDFPSVYTLRADPMPWRIYPGMPQTSDIYYYEIIRGSDPTNEVGHITVASYNNTAQANRAYTAVRAEAELEKKVQPLSIGSRGSKSGPVSGWNASDVIFELCNTVVHASIDGNNVDLLGSYAERLSTRIEPVVCSQK